MTHLEYLKAIDSACVDAGQGDGYWNSRFISSLQERGLKLVYTMPDMSDGKNNYMAPVPFASTSFMYQYPAWIIEDKP